MRIPNINIVNNDATPAATCGSGLTLKLPKPSPIVAIKKISANGLQRLLASFPVSSVKQTAKKLLHIVKKINRSSLPTPSRMKMNAILEPLLQQTLLALESQYVGTDNTFPTLTNVKAMMLVGTLLIEEMSFAYKTVVKECTNNHCYRTEEQDVLAPAVFYAIYWLSKLIYFASLLYKPAPSATWRDLHAVFAFAQYKQWHEMQMGVCLGPKVEYVEFALKDVYIQALLFAMADPTRMQPREMRPLYRVLPYWAKGIELTTRGGGNTLATFFAIDLGADLPPRHITLIKNRSVKNILVLDTGSIIQILVQILLERHVDLQSPDGCRMLTLHPLNDLPDVTIRRMIKTWGMVPKRSFTRTHMNMELPLVVGLDAICVFLENRTKQQDSPESEDLSASITTPIHDVWKNEENIYMPYRPNLVTTPGTRNFNTPTNELRLALDVSGDNVITPVDGGNVIMQKDNAPAPAIWVNEKSPVCSSDSWADSAVTDNTTTTRAINESIGGFCIDWSRANMPGVKIGGLIGVVTLSQLKFCAIAAVRWIHIHKGMRVGIQVISHQMKLVDIVPKHLREEQKPTRCLCSTNVTTTELPASLNLITPPFVLRMGADGENDIVVYDEGAERLGRLITVVESNSTFTWFRFEWH